MSYFLFLDDIRNHTDLRWPINMPLYEIITARDYKEFVHTIREKGIPAIVSFDMDLHESHYKEFGMSNQTSINYKSREPTGYDCAVFLVEECKKKRVPLPKYFVHSFNGLGKAKIFKYLRSQTDLLA